MSEDYRKNNEDHNDKNREYYENNDELEEMKDELENMKDEFDDMKIEIEEDKKEEIDNLKDLEDDSFNHNFKFSNSPRSARPPRMPRPPRPPRPPKIARIGDFPPFHLHHRRKRYLKRKLPDFIPIIEDDLAILKGFWKFVPTDETKTEQVLILSLPGVDKSTLSVKAKKTMISITGQYIENAIPIYGKDFIFRLRLPFSIDADDIKAKYNQGILTLSLRTLEEESTKISVD